jgi:hypothetical protein
LRQKELKSKTRNCIVRGVSFLGLAPKNALNHFKLGE